MPGTPQQVRGARLVAERIVTLGGVMVTTRPLLRCRVVGHLAWVGEARLFWFEANGSGEHNAYWLSYDELCRVGHRGVVFLEHDEIVAYLCLIETVSARDASEMRTAFELWKSVAATRIDLICSCCRRMTDRSAPRSCEWRLCSPGERDGPRERSDRPDGS